MSAGAARLSPGAIAQSRDPGEPRRILRLSRRRLPGAAGFHRRAPALAEPDWFVAGNRVLLSEAVTAAALRDHGEPERWGLGQFVARRLGGGINRLAPLFKLPLGPLRKLRPTPGKEHAAAISRSGAPLSTA